jgi:hypothetical protein
MSRGGRRSRMPGGRRGCGEPRQRRQDVRRGQGGGRMCVWRAAGDAAGAGCGARSGRGGGGLVRAATCCPDMNRRLRDTNVKPLGCGRCRFKSESRELSTNHSSFQPARASFLACFLLFSVADLNQRIRCPARSPLRFRGPARRLLDAPLLSARALPPSVSPRYLLALTNLCTSASALLLSVAGGMHQLRTPLANPPPSLLSPTARDLPTLLT